MTQGDVKLREKRKEESKHTVGLCMPTYLPPPTTTSPPFFPLVYSLFQFLMVDLLILNYVTTVAFSGSD